jgi:hypothetical protein
MLRLGRGRKASARFFRARRGNMHTIMALSGFVFSAVLGASYERGLLNRNAVLQPYEIQAERGNAYLSRWGAIAGHAFLSDLIYPEDSNAWPDSSTLEIVENDRRLGPAHALHAEIAALGSGRYSHWQGYLVFSSSDNTDPRSNGRIYSIRQSPSGILVSLGMALGILIALASIKRGIKTGCMAPVRSFLGMVVSTYRHVSGLSIMPKVLKIGTLLGIIAVEVYFLWKFGPTPIENRDGWFYARFADHLSFAAGVTPLPPAEDWRDIFVNFFRMPGYPLIISISKWIAGSSWQSFLVSVQLIFAVSAAYSVLRVSWRISGHFVVGLGCTALFLLSHRIQVDRAILTDSLCTSVITILVCHAVMASYEKRVPSPKALWVAGLSLACLFWIRETVVVISIAAAPLAFLVLSPLRSRREILTGLAAFYLPVFVSLLLVLSSNYIRTGYLFVTTQSMSSIFTAIMLERNGTSVFTGNNALDRVARETLKDYNYTEAMEINRRLLVDHGISGPEQAALAQQKYLQIWHDHPVPMAQLLMENLREWPNVFVVSELIDLFPKWYDHYVLYARFLAYLCAIITPLCILLLSIFIRSLGPICLIVSALLIFIGMPTFFYAAIVLEVRYLIFTTAPLLLILALFIRSIAMAFSELLGPNRPADSAATTSGIATAIGYPKTRTFQPKSPVRWLTIRPRLSSLRESESNPSSPTVSQIGQKVDLT